MSAAPTSEISEISEISERQVAPEAPPSDRALMREEYAIARKYLGRVPWEMVAWGLGNFALWLSLWPLVLTGVMPLWLGFIVSCICMSLAYLPSHEAQHSIIAAEGTKWRWLNELVGHVSTIPLVFPYRVAWLTHRQHHAHANDPLLDPDYFVKGDSWWQSVWNALKVRQPSKNAGYKRALEQSDDPMVGRALAEASLHSLSFYAILTALAWSGYAIEAALIWWLPRHIGFSYLLIFLSWAPHHPMSGKGRYSDTRAWKSPVGTLLSMGMEYHVVHHLFPKIPLFQTGRAYWEMRDLLLERGIRNEGL
jgi:beta-carotene hydroxylase